MRLSSKMIRHLEVRGAPAYDGFDVDLRDGR